MLAGHIFCTPRGCQNPRLFTYISLHVICFDSLSLIPSQPPIFGGWYQLHTSYIPHNRELGPYITGQPLTTWPHHPNWLKNLQPETHLDPVSGMKGWSQDWTIRPLVCCLWRWGRSRDQRHSGCKANTPQRRRCDVFFPHWFGGRDGSMAVWCCGTLQGWIGLEKFWKQSLRVTVRHAHRGESSPSVVHHGYCIFHIISIRRFCLLLLSRSSSLSFPDSSSLSKINNYVRW